MRHRNAHRKLSRNTSHRRAMLRNLVTDLLDHGRLMTTEGELRLALETASLHCRRGGVLLVMPDVIKETFVSLTTHGGHDGHDGDGRAIRYIEWTFDPDASDTTYTVDFAYLLREGNRPVRVVHDTHVFGIFPRETWLGLLRSCGPCLSSARRCGRRGPARGLG